MAGDWAIGRLGGRVVTENRYSRDANSVAAVVAYGDARRDDIRSPSTRTDKVRRNPRLEFSEPQVPRPKLLARS